MTTTVFNVANHILKHDKRFDLLQLIKLCYLSYGWYLAYHDEELFEEKIEAWKYGPVIPELYYALKHFKGQQLPRNCLKSLIENKGMKPIFPEEAKSLIEEIVAVYGGYEGMQLSALTHKRGTPWYNTYYGKRERPWVYIPRNVIKDYYDELRNRI